MENCWASKYCRQYQQVSCNQFCAGYVVLEILYHYSNIPKKYQYPVDLKVSPPDKETYQYISEILKGDIISWVNKGRNLFLWGQAKGTGKTTVACQIASKFIREMASKTNLEPVVHFIKSARFLEEIRQQFNAPTIEFPERLKTIETVPLLIIDDIGAEKPSDWVKERLLNIIDERYSNNRSIIYTSNCSLSEIMERLGDRIYDRIKDSKALEFKSASFRGLNND